MNKLITSFLNKFLQICETIYFKIPLVLHFIKNCSLNIFYILVFINFHHFKMWYCPNFLTGTCLSSKVAFVHEQNNPLTSWENSDSLHWSAVSRLRILHDGKAGFCNATADIYVCIHVFYDKRIQTNYYERKTWYCNGFFCCPAFRDGLLKEWFRDLNVFGSRIKM